MHSGGSQSLGGKQSWQKTTGDASILPYDYWEDQDDDLGLSKPSAFPDAAGVLLDEFPFQDIQNHQKDELVARSERLYSQRRSPQCCSSRRD